MPVPCSLQAPLVTGQQFNLLELRLDPLQLGGFVQESTYESRSAIAVMRSLSSMTIKGREAWSSLDRAAPSGYLRLWGSS